LQQIIRYDAVNLEETLTDDLVSVIQHWNFPKSKGIYLRFSIDVETPDVKEKIEAMQKAWEMGAKISERQLMDFVGATIPDEAADVLQNPQIQQGAQQQAAGNMAQGFGPGTGGGNPEAEQLEQNAAQETDPAGRMRDEITRYLFGDAENAKEGEIRYVAEGGRWVKRQIPPGDTGERNREERDAASNLVEHFQRRRAARAHQKLSRNAPETIPKPPETIRETPPDGPVKPFTAVEIVRYRLTGHQIIERYRKFKDEPGSALEYDGSQPLFVYGTFRTPSELDKVIGRQPQFQQDALDGFAHQECDDGYSDVVPQPGNSVVGDLVFLTPEELERTDDWEDRYQRRPVKLRSGIEADCYFPREALP
jgi:gamma-glutamylcyclotransferase (GGCT)/AIG2-like uncharacterized protein YtfP